MKEAFIFAGNYGSGKTELSLNMALDLSRLGRTVLCDMDVVNPYFRSAEHKEKLEQAGVRLIAPPFANTSVDVPALSAEVMAAFEYDYAVFDAGGDPVGASALGSFKHKFDAIRHELSFYYVVNARRPFQEDPEEIVVMLREIEHNARLKVDGLVNNTNLARDASVADLEIGAKICKDVTERTGIPVAFTSGTPEILDEYIATGYKGKTMPMQIYTRPDWLDTTADL